MASASTPDTYHQSLLDKIPVLEKHKYKINLINKLHDIFTHYETEYKKVTCNVQILKDCNNMLDLKSWNGKYIHVTNVTNQSNIEHYFEVFLGNRTNSLFKSIFDKQAPGLAVSIVTHSVIGNPVAIAYNLLQSCYKVGLAARKHINKKRHIENTSNKLTACKLIVNVDPKQKASEQEMKKICPDFSTLVGLLTSNGTMKESHDLSKNVFCLSFITFINEDFADPINSINFNVEYYKGRYGVLMTLSELYNIKEIQDNYVASSLVKDMFNVVATNLFEEREDSSINLATSISYSTVLSEEIEDKYDLDVDDILEPSGIYDSLYLYLIHMIHHDENKILKKIFTTFQYIEFQDPGEATFELISHINKIVCSKEPVICKERKKGFIKTVIESTSNTQGADRRDAQGDTVLTQPGGGGQGNKMTFVLTLAVLVASSLVGTLQ